MISLNRNLLIMIQSTQELSAAQVPYPRSLLFHCYRTKMLLPSPIFILTTTTGNPMYKRNIEERENIKKKHIKYCLRQTFEIREEKLQKQQNNKQQISIN